MSTHNVVFVLFGLVGGGGFITFCGDLATFVSDNFDLGLLETGESGFTVRDVETSVAGTLHGTESTVTSGGADETDVKGGLEGVSVFVGLVVDAEKFSINLGNTFVHLVHTLEGKETTSGEETGGVGRGVVGKTSGKTELLELGRVSLGHNAVTGEGGEDNLADDLGAGAADAESVLLAVVLVLVLEDKVATCLVVGLSFASASILGLVSAAICLVLLNLDECHLFSF